MSYQKLAEFGGDDVENELRYPRAWSWLLLLALLTSITNDETAIPADSRKFASAVKLLQRDGLIPANDLADVLGRSAFRNLEFSLWNIHVKGARETQGVTPSLTVLIQFLKELLATMETESKHIIVIDGLDDVLLDDKSQFQAVSGLILEVSRLNHFFREQQTPFKIIIVCRTDIYERLPGANQNKIRQDMAVELQWFEEAADPRRSNLVKLANLRAQYHDPRMADVFRSFFPKTLRYDKDTVRFLLDHTRHTPREFLQLLRYIQRAAGGAEFLDRSQIMAGLRSYCERFYLPEIRDELEGAIERAELNRFFECLRHFHRSQFSLKEISDFFRQSVRGNGVDIEAVVSALFNCSALGNCYVTRMGRTQFAFRYRNPMTVFNPDESIVVHRGLARALNLYGDTGR